MALITRQLCPDFPGHNGRRLVKRCTARKMRRLARRLLDDAPTKPPLRGYSD